MTLSPGTRVGPYEILSPLGAGGMGEVYRARDTRLDRQVAIKILPELFAADPDRLARFEREAKTLASLSHPQIAQIYGLEPLEDSTARALVMELVEGEDLSARIARGAIPAADALPMALQMADALEAAHERGIIHRDLKPANIKVTAEGALKVLDFGLAKAIEGSHTESDPRNSPTMSIAGTRAGMVLGTASYMAPEQARGHAVDRRADIWAFGVVLFEMLSGKPAFAGDSVSDVLASVLKHDLDWSALPADVPAPIRRLLRRCLDPDRRSRLRDVGEARVAIADFLAGKSDTERAPPAAPPQSRRALFAARALAGALAIALAVVLAAPLVRDRAPEDASKRFVVAPPERVTAHVASRPSVSIAPDGWTVAFAGLDNGVPHLYLRSPAEFDPRRLPGTEGGGNPEFSPDGRSLAFFTINQLKILPLDGVPAALATANDPRGLTWVDAATLVYAPESIGGLMELSVKGGTPRALTTIDEKAGERTHRWPHALPGGRWVLFTVGTTASPDDYDNSRIDAVDRTTGERRRGVFQDASMVRYAPTGHLVFARGGTLFAVAFDAAALKATGTPSSVQQGIGGDLTTGAAHVSWSPGGTFAYVPGDARGGMRQLSWVDLKGERQSITLPPALYNDIRISPDATRLAVAQGTSGNSDIWIYGLARGTYARVTFNSFNATPVWSADSRDVFFSAIHDGGRGATVFRTSADGGRDPVELTTVDVRVYLKHVSADGTWALVDYIAFGGARASIGRLQLKPGAKVEPIVDTRADEYAASLSPDGRFIAYQADPDGKPEVYVREITQTSGRWQISNAGGEEPMWSPDGRAIYYRIEGRMMMVPVDARGAFQPGLPVQLFDGVYNLRSDTGISYQPHPDGKRLLMARAADVVSGGSVRLITRWFDELKKIE